MLHLCPVLQSFPFDCNELAQNGMTGAFSIWNFFELVVENSNVFSLNIIINIIFAFLTTKRVFILEDMPQLGSSFLRWEVKYFPMWSYAFTARHKSRDIKGGEPACPIPFKIKITTNKPFFKTFPRRNKQKLSNQIQPKLCRMTVSCSFCGHAKFNSR